uniref:CCHC-type domain-containing protein n=2 Tax=Brassica TaxID=3705 RepID=A0A0D3CHM9_BRAOL
MLPKIVEVGRMDGSFVNVEVEYPWTPPICAHCKEMGHISRNCHLLPVPPITDPPQHPIPPNPKSTTSQKQFCYSCKASGHLMKNCPKGPKDWVQISRKKKHTCSTVDEPQVGSQQTPSYSLPKEPSDHQHLPDTSISIDPDTATDVLTNDLGTVLPPPVPASMDIDSPPPPLPSVSLDTNLVSSTSSITIPPTEPISPPHLTNCVLGLAAVCPPRPVIPNNHLTTPKISFTSLNPFQLLSPPGNSLQLSPPNSPRTSPITCPKSPAKVPTFEIIYASPSLDPSPLPVTLSSPAVLNSDQSANDLHLPHPEAGTPFINMCTNIFSWNVCGFNDQDKHHPFVQWLALHKPLVGVILETHIKEPNLNPILSKVCPNWSFCSNHDTYEDGRIIVILKYPASVQVMHQSRQSLTCEVSIPRLPRFTFTVVYASNLWEERHTLWGELQEIQTTLFLDHRNWIIGGDFNQITHHHEHSSPSVDQLTSAMIELQDHFLNLRVNDLKFQGSHHTWTNKCPAAPTTKKLDQALVSGHWIEAFPGSVASFLPYEFSDHTPCLIDLSCPLPSVGTRPFKYFNFLPNHPSFLTAVENAWVLSGSTTLDLHMYKL